MEKIITKYLKDTLEPNTIIFHGSRACGRERAHSDWDFICLFNDNNSNPGSFRDLVEGQNVEVFSVTLPVDDILKTFGNKLLNARVVYDTNSVGETLVADAQKIYSSEYKWPSTWPLGPKLWMMGRLDGMRDTIDAPQYFLRYLGQFHQRALNYWFQIKNKRYSKPIYQALDEIKIQDPQYFAYLETLADSKASTRHKVDAAEGIMNSLFN